MPRLSRNRESESARLHADRGVTEFWKNYFLFAQEHHPELGMREPGVKPANSDWPAFRPTTLGGKMTIVHKLSRGVVDLQLPGMGDKLDELNESISEYLSDEIELVQTNKSASLRISVPVVDKTMQFEDQAQNVAQGLVAARRLLGIGKQMI